MAHLPPDLFDQTTIISLLSTLAIVLAAYLTSRALLPSSTSTTLRFFFIWHLADALCHFILEGSFLYHCFFSHVPAADEIAKTFFPTSFNYLGWGADRAYGAQAGGSNPFAQLWMVYARADKRWAGADLGVVSLELLTVFFDGPLALYICYCIVQRDPKTPIWMIILATCELYGGKTIYSSSIERPMADERRIHDLLPRVADRQHQLGYQQLHVHVGVPGLLQHAVGVHPAVRDLLVRVRHLWRFERAQSEEEPVKGQLRADLGQCYVHEEGESLAGEYPAYDTFVIVFLVYTPLRRYDGFASQPSSPP